MEYFEIAVSFLLGLALVVLLGWVFSLKSKGIARLVLNTLAGAILLVCFNLFNIILLPINPFNALLIGFLGIGGVAVVFFVTVFL